jgi:hypothetical protein
MDKKIAVRLFYGKLIPYNLWIIMSLLWKVMSLLWNIMSLLWKVMSLLWKIMLLIVDETAASQDRPGRKPGPPPRVGTSIGTCLSPNRQGTPESPACARYGKETPVMERKRRLWKISDLYGKKATFMENKRPLWKESVVLWKIKFTYGKKVLVWPLYG